MREFWNEPKVIFIYRNVAFYMHLLGLWFYWMCVLRMRIWRDVRWVFVVVMCVLSVCWDATCQPGQFKSINTNTEHHTTQLDGRTDEWEKLFVQWFVVCVCVLPRALTFVLSLRGGTNQRWYIVRIGYYISVKKIRNVYILVCGKFIEWLLIGCVRATIWWWARG